MPWKERPPRTRSSVAGRSPFRVTRRASAAGRSPVWAGLPPECESGGWGAQSLRAPRGKRARLQRGTRGRGGPFPNPDEAGHGAMLLARVRTRARQADSWRGGACAPSGTERIVARSSTGSARGGGARCAAGARRARRDRPRHRRRRAPRQGGRSEPGRRASARTSRRGIIAVCERSVRGRAHPARAMGSTTRSSHDQNGRAPFTHS